MQIFPHSRLWDQSDHWLKRYGQIVCILAKATFRSELLSQLSDWSQIGSCPNQRCELTLAGLIHLRWVIKGSLTCTSRDELSSLLLQVNISLFMIHLRCIEPARVHAKSWFVQDPILSVEKSAWFSACVLNQFCPGVNSPGLCLAS